MTRIDALVGVGGVIVLVVLFVVETRAPLRRRVRPRGERLAVNVVLAVSAGLVVRLAVVAVGLRLVQLQVVSADEYAARGLAQRLHTLPIAAERGTLFDRNGNALAMSVRVRGTGTTPGAPVPLTRAGGDPFDTDTRRLPLL